jgi:hypothetical protein
MMTCFYGNFSLQLLSKKQILTYYKSQHYNKIITEQIFMGSLIIQNDQKENKLEQALQMIGHVLADSKQISVQCMSVDNLWSQTLSYNKSYLMNFRRWNYN